MGCGLERAIQIGVFDIQMMYISRLYIDVMTITVLSMRRPSIA